MTLADLLVLTEVANTASLCAVCLVALGAGICALTLLCLGLDTRSQRAREAEFASRTAYAWAVHRRAGQ